jgi:hypothetical protein
VATGKALQAKNIPHVFGTAIKVSIFVLFAKKFFFTKTHKEL